MTKQFRYIAILLFICVGFTFAQSDMENKGMEQDFHSYSNPDGNSR